MSPKKNKEIFQLPTVTNRKCLEARYSGSTSLPLLSNHSPVTCDVVKHKDVSIDGDTESVTTLDPHTNATTPSDVPSMSIAPYANSPTSWCSLPSVENSPTPNKSGSPTPAIRLDNTTPNPGSRDVSPTHNHFQCESTTW